MLADGAAVPYGLSRALAAYIPKKGLTVGGLGVQARPSEAQPLALNNSAAKIPWRVLARSVMPALDVWAHRSQRGFVHGRVPGQGVIDIDCSARCVAMLHRLGVLGLFDFTAAFPSISRELILRVLAAARFPQWAIDVTDASWKG